jgi:hypothetical protein
VFDIASLLFTLCEQPLSADAAQLVAVIMRCFLASELDCESIAGWNSVIQAVLDHPSVLVSGATSGCDSLAGALVKWKAAGRRFDLAAIVGELSARLREAPAAAHMDLLLRLLRDESQPTAADVLRGLEPLDEQQCARLLATVAAVSDRPQMECARELRGIVELFRPVVRASEATTEGCAVAAAYTRVVVACSCAEQLAGVSRGDDNDAEVFAVFAGVRDLITRVGPNERLTNAALCCCARRGHAIAKRLDCPAIVKQFAVSRIPQLIQAARCLCRVAGRLPADIAADVVAFYLEVDIKETVEAHAILKLMSVLDAQFPDLQTLTLLSAIARIVDTALAGRFVRACCRTVGLAVVTL